MRMSLEKLLKDRIIEKVEPNRHAAERTFRISERDIKTAKSMIEAKNYDWGLIVAYNAMLQAGRSLMHLKGYRPYSEHKHVAVIEFVHALFGTKISDKMVNIFDRMRKKRHRIVYEEAGIVSEDEAEQAIKWSEEFVQTVRKILFEGK